MARHAGDCAASACTCASAPPADASALVDPTRWSTQRRRALRRGAQARSVTAATPVTTLLLDIGGVVIPTLFESVVTPELPPGPFGDDAAYALVERGGGQERDYWLQLIDRRPDVDIGALWRACSYVRHEVRDVVARIAGRVRVVAFTNDMAHWFGDDWRQRFAELAAFDDVLEASTLGVLKPAPEAFARAAAAIGEDPVRCLFVDDLPANLEGAEGVGMATLHFDVRDPQRSIDALLARLGLAATAGTQPRIFVAPRAGGR